ncbi:hypothetical protein O3M35_000582 [Rhynocoris fuscipes]|uniref:Uncharacterized protein n=1 Tax=Rhynocoris fuscipes TaxID=488301 RepID=A0AAW1DRU2_9HEMI
MGLKRSASIYQAWTRSGRVVVKVNNFPSHIVKSGNDIYKIMPGPSSSTFCVSTLDDKDKPSTSKQATKKRKLLPSTKQDGVEDPVLLKKKSDAKVDPPKRKS